MDWEQSLYTKEEFDKLYEASGGFEDCVPCSPPVRPEGETFAEFIDKGSQALLEKYPDLVKQLL